MGRTFSVENFARFGLVMAQGKRFTASAEQPQIKGNAVAGDVPGQVFGGVTNVDEGLLDMAAPRRINSQGVGIFLFQDVGLQLFAPQQFQDKRNIFRR